MPPFEQTSTPSAIEPVPPPRSPGWELFRLNAFRVLRLSVSVTAQQAVFEAADVLSVLAVPGMARPGVDELPWLDEPDEVEVQRVAQRIEEPIHRLVDQLLWFDFENNPDEKALRAALATLDASKVEVARHLLDATPPELPAEPDDEAFVQTSRALDAAVFSLVAALGALHGRIRDPEPKGSVPGARVAIPWSKGADGASADQVHVAVGAALSPPPSLDPKIVLRDAIASWSALLSSQALTWYVRRLIQRLGDEMVTPEDAETVIQAVWTSIADAVAGELRYFVVEGRVASAAAIGGAVAESGTPAHAWVPSFKPLRNAFQVEIDELDALVNEGADLDAVEIYLQRIETLGCRWKPIDLSGFLGLDQLIDQGVLRAFQRVKSIEDPLSLEEYLDRAMIFHDLLATTAKLARSESLRQRVLTFSEQLDRRKARLCHFCERKPTSDDFVLLTAKREVSRERIGFNQVRVTYQTLHRLVMRCESCANLHAWVRLRALVLSGAGLLSALALTLNLWEPQQRELVDSWAYYGVFFFVGLLTLAWFRLGPINAFLLALFGAGGALFVSNTDPQLARVAVAVGAAILIIPLAGAAISLWVTPRRHRRYWDIKSSEGYRDMVNLGFGMHITRNYSKGAAKALLASS